jgi:hypothetical protein
VTFRTRRSPHKEDDAVFIECPCGHLTIAASKHEGKIVLENRSLDQEVSFPWEATEEIVQIIRSFAADLSVSKSETKA